MNCLNANVEDNAYILKNKNVRNKKRAQLSDFIFWRWNTRWIFEYMEKMKV